MLSPTDIRVIAYLRQRKIASLSSIAAACFALAGKPKDSATRPAAAHLSRMVERRLIRREGNRYHLVIRPEEEMLFETP